MNLYSTRADLLEAISVIQVMAEDKFSLRGRTQQISNRPLPITVPSPRSRLAAEMTNDLYLQYYTRQGSIPPIMPDATLVDEFCERLSQANEGKGLLSHGWRKLAITGDKVLVQHRLGATRTIPGANFIGTSPEGSIRRPKDSYKREPVFYYAFSDYEPEEIAFEEAYRCYFAVMAAAAPLLVSAVTRRLNGERLPFRFKILRDPQRYFRADRAVLYIRPDDWSRAAPLVAACWRDVRRYLVDKTPPFARRLAPGLAVAQSPAIRGESFGSHRCRLIVEGLIDGFSSGACSPEAIREHVVARFNREGIHEDFLYLRGGTHDPF